MTNVQLTIDPGQTPEEEAALVARVAAALVEETGEEDVRIELTSSEQVRVAGTGVAERMQSSARWSA